MTVSLPLHNSAGHPPAVPLMPRVGTAGYALFVLINATLFIRPAEVVPALMGLPIYEILNLACIGICFQQILTRLTGRELKNAPVTVCVLGLQASVILSHLSHFEISRSLDSAIFFVKPLLYYLMLVSVVDTPRRLNGFLTSLLLFTAALTFLALLHHHEVINVPAMAAVKDRWSAEGDEEAATEVVRICAAGIFGNPNDFARILVVGMLLALYRTMQKRAGVLRLLWAVLFLMMGYALHLTHSRGGLLSMMTGVGVLMWARIGWIKSAVVGAFVAPVLLVAFAGRQLDMTTKSGTGQHRIQLWIMGFEELKRSPLFGIGMQNYAEYFGLVAHNSFVHCFVELGVIGGAFFAGSFFLAAWGPYKLVGKNGPPLDDEMRRLRAYVLAIIAGVVVGMLSSTRSYEIPTYAFLGISSAYMQVATARRSIPEFRVSGPLVRKTLAASMSMLVLTFLYARKAVNWE